MQVASDVVSGQAILSAVLHLSLAIFWKAWNSLKWLKRTTPGKKNNIFSWQSFLYTREICETNFSVIRHSIITWFWVRFGVKKHKQIFQTKKLQKPIRWSAICSLWKIYNFAYDSKLLQNLLLHVNNSHEINIWNFWKCACPICN